MIVKVQRSLYTTSGHARMLIYDRKQLFTYEGPLTQHVADFMGDDLKIYAKAEYHIPSKKITLHKRVADRNW